MSPQVHQSLANSAVDQITHATQFKIPIHMPISAMIRSGNGRPEDGLDGVFNFIDWVESKLCMNDAVFTFRKDDPLATDIDSCSAVWIVDEIAQIEGQARPGELSPVPPYLREIPLAPVAVALIAEAH